MNHSNTCDLDVVGAARLIVFRLCREFGSDTFYVTTSSDSDPASGFVVNMVPALETHLVLDRILKYLHY